MKRYFNSGPDSYRNFRYILVLCLFFVCGSFKAYSQNIQVEAKLDSVSIPIGQQTRLHIIAHIQAKDEITFPQLADSIAHKILIVKVAKPDTSFDKNNLQSETITRDYIITSFTPGTYTIPVYTLHTKTAAYSTDSLTFQVTTVAVDTTKAIYDIKQPLAVSYTFWDWLKDNWLWVVIPLVVILAVIGFIYYLKKRPKKEVVVEKTAPALPDYTIALNKLYALRDKKLWQQEEFKAYYIELTDVLRDYLEKRYQIKAHEQTTDEIFLGLRNKSIPANTRNILKQVLVLADLVKFAKEKPLPNENEQSMENAIGFVMLTKQEIPLAGNKEELPK